MTRFWTAWIGLAPALAFAAPGGGELLFEDGFETLRPGMFSPGPVGAHAEYHYLLETAPKGSWAVSTFSSSADSQCAWRVVRMDGRAMMAQTWRGPAGKSATHPMVVAGDPRWRDYEAVFEFAPQSAEGRSGAAVRYRNDRCYYFAGVEGTKAILLRVRHEKALGAADEETLAEAPFAWTPGGFIALSVRVEGDSIRAQFADGPVLEARDTAYAEGRIALISDGPALFAKAEARAAAKEARRFAAAVARDRAEEDRLQARNPKMKLWKKFAIKEFGVGRNVRFGDLDGDGRIDMLFGQVLHHGPKDSNSEISCLTATNLDGQVLWQVGQPDSWKNHLTNDVGFQIHDLDGDGRAEVVYCMNQEIVVADGATGKTKYKAPTPESPPGGKSRHNRFPRILGDSLFFCDLRGQGRMGDLIVKDRYNALWAYDENLNLRWSAACNTGHYPFAFDADSDGRDELFIGYSLYDADGNRIWTLDGTLKDHADGLAVARFAEDGPPVLLCAASNEGILFIEPLTGRILKHHRLGHVQNPAIANFRDDLPGLEAVSINFWGNQGIVHFYDAQGETYHDFEPCQHGSMCLPVNWSGAGAELWCLSPDVVEGGLFDGMGRKAVAFPADGHPVLCNAVLDLTGDARDEIVVWDPNEVWIYTQDDNPKTGRLYKPIRNSLSNYSNYQATISLPGWTED